MNYRGYPFQLILALACFLSVATYSWSDEVIPPVRDFLTEEETQQLAAPASNTFDFTVKVRIVNGPPENRVNMAYAGDGYAASDTNEFYAIADSNIAYRRGLSSIPNNAMVVRPLPRYDKFFNWYCVNLISSRTGLPGPLGGDTYDRLGTVNVSAANNLFSQVESELGITLHWRTAILNAPGYYNSGGPIAVYARENWGDIACHEQGHTFHTFADEYFGTNGSTDTREYHEMNSTAEIGSKKWSAWVGYRDIDERTRSGGGAPNTDTVGFFEGSRYVQHGQYRPTSNSKMNMTGQNNPVSFNAPCREKIIQDIYAIVSPIDSMLAADDIVVDPESIWVQVIDPDVLKVDWYVDGTLKKPDGGGSIRAGEIASAPGTFTVKAHVYDEAIRHAFGDNATPDPLDIVRGDTSKLVQDVEWEVSLSNVAITRAARKRPEHLLSIEGNSVVYSLNRPAKVTLSLIKMNGVHITTVSTNGNTGNNRIRYFEGTGVLPAGVYLLKVTTGVTSRIIRVMVR